MEEKQLEIQQLISLAQHLLHKAEVRYEHLKHNGGADYQIEAILDSVQASLVDAQLAFVENKTGEELYEAFFPDGPRAKECKVEWDERERLLKLFIPDVWERVNTRPSIYIKDLSRSRNAAQVKLFYTKLFNEILRREMEGGHLEGFKKFEKCYAGFLFHFHDEYVRDPDNFVVKVLVDAAKMSGIFLTDDYRHFVYSAGGVTDKYSSGITLYFSDSVTCFEHMLGDIELVKMNRNHIRQRVEKLYSEDVFNDEYSLIIP